MVARVTTRGALVLASANHSSPLDARTRPRTGPGEGRAEVCAAPGGAIPLASFPAGSIPAGGVHGAAEAAASAPGHSVGRRAPPVPASFAFGPLPAISEEPGPGLGGARGPGLEGAPEARVAPPESDLPPARAPRGGELGRLYAEEMEHVLDAVEAEAPLRGPLESEGLWDTLRLLEVGGGGLRSPYGSGLAYQEAHKRLALHARRGGCTLDDAELHRRLDRVVRMVALRETESTNLRAAAAGVPGAGLVGKGDRGFAGPDPGPADRPTASDRDRALCDGLLNCVTRQQNGKPLTAMMTPTLGDIVSAAEALSRNPARLPRFQSLSLDSRVEDKGGDTMRHRKDKTFKHKRAVSAEEEYRLLDDYLVVVGVAGAQMAPDTMKVAECDEGSGVKLETDEGPAEHTVLISQFPALRAISAQVRRSGMRARLGGAGARTYVDALLESATEFLVTRPTATAALTMALDKHLELQSKSTGSSGTKHGRDSGSESESSSESESENGDSSSSRRKVGLPSPPFLTRLRSWLRNTLASQRKKTKKKTTAKKAKSTTTKKKGNGSGSKKNTEKKGAKKSAK